MADLKLYISPTCPFCKKVLNFMKDEGITLPLADRDFSTEIKEELVRIGGKPQVPCLIINGKALYESDDIIQWLKDNPDALT